MEKTSNHVRGVMGVLALAQVINPEIGSYQEHFINESFRYAVRLSNNGAIEMSVEVAEDYEALPSSVTPERVQNVVRTFRKI